jgi:asparagine N-glycosylation enzyme membrane subunit Stt3
MEGESEDRDLLEKRKEKAIDFFKKKKSWIVYLVLLVIVYLGYFLRTRNLGYLTDVTTGKYIPLALDPFAFLKYVTYILENGSLMAVDMMRYWPWGYSSMGEFSLLSNFIVYMYKVWHLFVPSVTIEFVHIMYPVVCFIIGLVFFFLFVKELFDWRVGLLASGFLAVLPAFLYRTMAGFADKEAFAIMLMFIALFFYALVLKRKNFKVQVLGAVVSGFMIGLMAIVWGGSRFLFLTIGVYILVIILMNRFSKKDLILNAILVLVITIVAMVGYPERFYLGTLLFSLTTGILYLGLLIGFVNYLLFEVIKIKKLAKMPKGLFSLLVVIVLGLIVLLIAEGPAFFGSKIVSIYLQLTEPFGSTRWALTVAESHQPYFVDWVAQFTWGYLLLFYAGAILLFYEMVKRLKMKYILTALFGIFIFVFSMSRYSASSIFNGQSTISLLFYIGSLVLFVVLMLYYFLNVYYNNKEEYSNVLKMNAIPIFVLLFFFFMVLGARSAIRLLFLFAPITCVLASFAVFYIVDKSGVFKDKVYKWALVIAVAILAIFLLFSFYGDTLTQAKYTGPSYNQQWQVGMEWVRDNTADDAVFAHWWDYGYWVQYGGERTTLSDGGNAGGAGINHYIGRHVLTGQNETEALEYLYAREATHLLMISDEIGKYGAYSSIGSDANYDRYSWIPSFGLDMDQVQETRNETILVYTGGTYLDEDVIYQDILFPSGSAAVVAFTVPVEINDDGSIAKVNSPSVILSYNGQQASLPLRSISLNGEEIIFEGEEEYFEGCLLVIPTYNGDQYSVFGSSLYLSPRVYRGLFAQLFLLENEEYSNFDLVYTDEASMPLSYYNGQLIGPLKIWEISYPDDLEIPEHYYSADLNDLTVNEV